MMSENNHGPASTPYRELTPEQLAEKRQREEPTLITRLPDLQRQLASRNLAREKAAKSGKNVTGIIIGTSIAALAAVGVILTHHSKSQEQHQQTTQTSTPTVPTVTALKPIAEPVPTATATVIPTATAIPTAEASADLPEDINLDNDTPSATASVQTPKKAPPKSWPNNKDAGKPDAKKAPPFKGGIIRETPF